jgi:hypothetical protein
MVLKKKEAVEPDYTATVLLAGKKVMEVDREGYDTKLIEGTIEAKDLPIGEKGPFRRYSYKLKGPQPQAEVLC